MVEGEVKNNCLGPSLSNYKVIFPNYTTFSVKNLKNAINFHPNKTRPCKNSWYQDLRLTHIRNKRLLDLPFKRPKCCSDIYNMIVDRQKLKKLQKYGLTRPVRILVSNLEMEKVERCRPAVEQTPVEIIPVDCAQIPESDSEDEDDDDDDDDDNEDEYDFWLNECKNRCSECYTIDKANMRHKVIKKDWRDLLHGSEEEYCKGVVREIMEKYKGSLDAELKLKARF